MCPAAAITTHYSGLKGMNTSTLPIGIFDSGVGGLTVFSAIEQRLPHEQLLYLGDTARLPYGTKSTETITRYALQASAKLVERNIKALVIACNTASAAALPALRAAYPHIPVIGVIEPGAQAAVAATQSGNVLVLATEATINNKAYQKAIQQLAPTTNVTGIACSLFVALAEEGWANPAVTDVYSGKTIAQIVASQYLSKVFTQNSTVAPLPDCIVLGCTHFPPLASAIQAVVGNNVAIVDSAATTALAVEAELQQRGILHPKDNGAPMHQFLTTDAPDRFARVGTMFLHRTLNHTDIELVYL